MGLLSGNANFVEFEVSGDLPDFNSPDFAAERINIMGFQDIDDTHDEYSIGWVSPMDMFLNDFQSMEAGIVVASLRIDERKVPSAVLKKSVAKAFKQVMEDKQIPRLSRAMKIEIKERVRFELMKKAEPVAIVTEMVWDVDNHLVLFFSTNKKVQALFEDFFKETFGLTVRQEVPYTIAEGISRINQEDLAAVSACQFI